MNDAGRNSSQGKNSSGSASTAPSTSTNVNVGILAVKAGLITQAQLKEAADEASRRTEKGIPTVVTEILVQKGYVTPEKLALLLPAAKELPAPPGVFGKYKILQELGQGSTGTIYEVQDTEAGVKVALKLFQTFVHGDPADVTREEQRFMREARLYTALPPHPNVVRAIDAGFRLGKQYIVMELVKGQDLAEGRKSKRYPLAEQVRVLRDAALGLQHAHANKIIHRDVKPQNIIVDAGGRARITDFGLSRPLGMDKGRVMTSPGTIIGTLGYMSPEQILAPDKVDARSDVYSLGMVLYEILAGKLPFPEDASVLSLPTLLKQPIPPPLRASKAPGSRIHVALEMTCMKAVSKNPGDRHPTAQAMADELTRWLKVDEAAKPVGDLAGNWRWLWWVGAGAAVIATGAVLLIRWLK